MEKQKLIYVESKALFSPSEVSDKAIVFIKDTKEIWTHGVYFSCSGTWASPITLSLTGDTTGSVSIDGSGNVTLLVTNHYLDVGYGHNDANSALSPTHKIQAFSEFAPSLSNGFPATNYANAIININTHSQNYDHQLGFSSNKGIYHRTRSGGVWDSSWEKLLTSTNYTNFPHTFASLTNKPTTISGYGITDCIPIISGGLVTTDTDLSTLGMTAAGAKLSVFHLYTGPYPTWLNVPYMNVLMFRSTSDSYGAIGIELTGNHTVLFIGGRNAETTTNNVPNWWFRIKGASGATYDLNSFLSVVNNLSNYVTINTDQVITSYKIFKAAAPKDDREAVYYNIGLKLTSYGEYHKKVAAIGMGNEPQKWYKAAIGFERTGTYDRGDIVLLFNNIEDQTTCAYSDIKVRINAAGNISTLGTVSASGFKKTESSDSYVLLGGGGHKAISDFALTSSLNNYVTLSTDLAVSGKKLFNNQLIIRKDVGDTDSNVIDIQHDLQLQVRRDSNTHSVAIGVMPTGAGVIWAKANGIGYNTLYLNPYNNGVAIGCGSNGALPNLNDGYYFHIFGSTLSNNSITATKFIKSGGTSSQFLKADGSLDSTTYLPLSGGTMTGALNFANNTWNKVGDDAYMGDCNVAGMIGIKGSNAATPGFAMYNNSGTLLGKLYASGTSLYWSDAKILTASGTSKLFVMGDGSLYSDTVSYTTWDKTTTSGIAWFPIADITDDGLGTALFMVRGYAHSSIIFTVVKGWNNGNINVLAGGGNFNSSYAYIRGVRLIGTVVEIGLNAAATYVSVVIRVLLPTFTYSLRSSLVESTSTTTPYVQYDINSEGNHNFGIISSKFTGNLIGNADTASKWKDARTITLTGDVTGSVTLDGSSNVTLTTTTSGTGTTSFLKCPDKRNSYPALIVTSGGNIGAAFISTSTLGLSEGYYCDTLILRGYATHTAGYENALFFNKQNSSVYHSQYTFGSTTTWGTMYKFLDSSNYSSYALPLSGGTMTGAITLTSGSDAANAKTALSFIKSSDKSEQARIGTDITNGLGLYARGTIYIRPNVTLGSGSTNGLVISNSSFTYNGNAVLTSSNYTNYTIGYANALMNYKGYAGVISDGKLYYNNTLEFARFVQHDNSGRFSYELIAELTNYGTGTNTSYITYGISGFMWAWRGGNGANSGAYPITAIVNVGPAISLNMLRIPVTTNALIPFVVKYNGKYYIALRKKGSSTTFYFMGAKFNLLTTSIIVDDASLIEEVAGPITETSTAKYYYNNGTPQEYLHAGNYSSYALPLSGGTMSANGYIAFPASANSSALGNSTPMGITYGRIHSYGTLTIAGDTDASKTEFVNIVAGRNISQATAANGLSIGYNTLKWQGTDISLAGHNHDDSYLKLAGGTLGSSSASVTELRTLSSTAALRIMSYSDSTNYILSSNSAFTGNATLKITGYNNVTGTNLHFKFNNIYCRDNGYINIDSGNYNSYALPLSGGTLTGTLISRDIRPSANVSYSLGTSSYYYNYVYAKYFKKKDSSDSYVLLGGGGHKAVSDFTMKELKTTTSISGNTDQWSIILEQSYPADHWYDIVNTFLVEGTQFGSGFLSFYAYWLATSSAFNDYITEVYFNGTMRGETTAAFGGSNRDINDYLRIYIDKTNYKLLVYANHCNGKTVRIKRINYNEIGTSGFPNGGILVEHFNDKGTIVSLPTESSTMTRVLIKTHYNHDRTIKTSKSIYASSFYENSDIRLKENIRGIDLSDLTKLVDLVQFNFKDSDTKKYGVIAQLLELVGLQNLVYENDGKKAVDYISLLVLEIQRLRNEIGELKLEINKKS